MHEGTVCPLRAPPLREEGTWSTATTPHVIAGRSGVPCSDAGVEQRGLCGALAASLGGAGGVGSLVGSRWPGRCRGAAGPDLRRWLKPSKPCGRRLPLRSELWSGAEAAILATVSIHDVVVLGVALENRTRRRPRGMMARLIIPLPLLILIETSSIKPITGGPHVVLWCGCVLLEIPPVLGSGAMCIF